MRTYQDVRCALDAILIHNLIVYYRMDLRRRLAAVKLDCDRGRFYLISSDPIDSTQPIYGTQRPAVGWYCL